MEYNNAQAKNSINFESSFDKNKIFLKLWTFYILNCFSWKQSSDI